MKALFRSAFVLISAIGLAASPANDQFSDAIGLSGVDLTVTGDNFGATGEPGEPEHDEDSSRRASVWYRWTAPADGFTTIRTAGSDFDTVLGVYKGATVNALTRVALNDEADDTDDSTSKVVFQTTAGATYSIVVDGYFGDTGIIVLSLKLVTGVTVPPNDSYVNAIVLTGSPVSTDGNNYLATMEVDADYNPDGDGGKSVWWVWTAPTTGRYVITTEGSDFDTRLFVNTDTMFVDWNDDDVGRAAAVHIKAQAGVRYHIAVQGFGGASGLIHLEIRPDPPVRAPDWTLTDMNGQVWHLSDFAGKVVMLDFWATWCGPCVSEIPDFIDMQNKYGPDGFVIIGVSTDDNGFDDVIPFVNANGVNYISTIVTPDIENAYGPLTAIPVTFIIDREGMIDQRLLGSRPRATFDSILTPLIYPVIEVALLGSREGNDLVLKWPTAATGYILQSSNDISSAANWLPAGLDISVSGDLNVVRAPMTQGQRWFRLIHN